MAFKRRLTGVTTLCLWSIASAAAGGHAPRSAREVLPDGIVPTHYDLALAPDAEALTFTAKVAITLDVRIPSSSVTVNAVGLTFDHAAIDGGPDAAVSLDATLGRATFDIGRTIAAGRHILAIEYHGKIGRSTLGFFAMDYTGPDGPRRTLATNFEPAAARELLPCWDEPGRKATFTVSVDSPPDRMAVSNMPVAEMTSLSPTLRRVRFVQTPKMSTYLLFVGVGDFERIHEIVDGVDVGVIVKRGDTGEADYALDQAGKILHYYNEYFGIPFPLPKLDLIAAPGQISGGSMENWGAIFYSQNHLLFDPKSSTEEDRQLVFLVVAHEMAHQWFGDLVTMAWWSDLWLNEGFARWMQTFIADDLHPGWQTGLKASSIFEQGKRADAAPSTHPVVQDVDTADQASQSFDSITYDKGAAVITMLNAYVGRDKFREGVRRYMHAHAYGNTIDTDLWQPIQQAVGQPIVGMEHDFTRQEGVPLVRVTRVAQAVHLAQSRFAEDPATAPTLPRHRWLLPLAVGQVGREQPYVLLHGVANVAQPPPLLVNAGQKGYARVLYADDLLAGLTARMGTLQPMDQIGLLYDARALGIAGYESITQIMNLATALPADANPIVWQHIVRMLQGFDDYYRDAPSRAAFRRFALGMLAPLAARVGPTEVPGESPEIAILRSTMLEAEGGFGDAEVIAVAQKRLDAGDGTPTEQRSALMIVAARADPATFDALRAGARKTSDPLQKQRMFQALADVLDPALARRMLDIALSDEVPAGSAPSLISHLAHNHPDLVWGVLGPRLDDPTLPFEKTRRWLIAVDVAGWSSDPRRIADLEAYEARSVPPEARKPFLEGVASIEENIRVAKDILPRLDRWIATRPPSFIPGMR